MILNDSIVSDISSNSTLIDEQIFRFQTTFQDQPNDSVVTQESRADSTNDHTLNSFEIAQQVLSEKIIHALLDDDFEYGLSSKSEILINKLLEVHPILTKDTLGKILTNNYGNRIILISLLRVLSHIDYEKIDSQGLLIVAACFSHTDNEVVECAIRCCENWENTDSLKILEHAQCREDWLNNYLVEVRENIAKRVTKWQNI